MRQPKLSLVIPCFNEAKAVKGVSHLLQELRNRIDFQAVFSDLEVIVVDDGSDDGSREMLSQQEKIHLVLRERQGGYGAALRDGFSIASGDYIGFLDMDGSYDPRQFPELFHSLMSSHADVAFGNRLNPGSGMPPIRQVGNWIFSLLVRLLCGNRITDVCTGMRLFHRRHLPVVLSVQENDLNYSMALTLKLLYSGLKLIEVPIHYFERTGESKLKVWHDGWAFLGCILRHRYAS